MSDPIPAPEGQVVKKELHLFFLLDCSGSMSGHKIEALNRAIREVVPDLRKALASYPQVRVLVRCIRFSDRAEWHGGEQPVDLERFVYTDLTAGGITATAQAIRLLAGKLSPEHMPPKRGLPPVCILLSDGFCTDPEPDYASAIAAVDSEPWGKAAIRLAIAAGEETDYDEAQLTRFINQPEVGLLKAKTPEAIIKCIKWSSTNAVVRSSQGKNTGLQGNPEDNSIF